jgi:hypothetical protein
MGLMKDGGVVVGTSEYKPGNGQTRPAIAKFNADGSLAFHGMYEVPVQYIGVSAVCQIKDGRYVFVMQYALGTTVVVVNPSTGQAVSRVFEPTDETETPIHVIPTADGGFATLSQKA